MARVNPNRPTRRQLFRDYWLDCVPVEDLPSKYGYADASSIYRLLKKYNIPRRGMPVKAAQRKAFTPQQCQIIIGTVLGDGYLAVPTRCRWAQLSVEHSAKQEAYTEWKRQQLAPFSAPELERYPPRPNYIDGHLCIGPGSVRFRTCVHPDLYTLRNMFYPQGKKVVTPEILNLLDDAGLAVWIMDDGVYHQRDKRLMICTGGFTEAEQQLMQRWFLYQHGLRCKYHFTHPETNYWLVFGVDAARKLVDKVGPHIHPSLLYKIGC